MGQFHIFPVGRKKKKQGRKVYRAFFSIFINFFFLISLSPSLIFFLSAAGLMLEPKCLTLTFVKEIK